MLSRARLGAAIAVVLAMLVGVALLGFAGASALVPTGGTEPVSPQAYVPDDNGARVSVVTPDIAEGNLPWAVRVYRSRTGLTCFEAGRVQGQLRNGELGQVDPDDGKFRPEGLDDAEFGQVDPDSGSFRRIPVEAGVSCIDLNDAPSSIAVNHYPAQPHRGARAVVFGVISPDVNAVSLLVDGQRRELSVSADGYVAAMTEEEAGLAQLIFSMKDGTEKRVSLSPGPKPTVQPSPPES